MFLYLNILMLFDSTGYLNDTASLMFVKTIIVVMFLEIRLTNDQIKHF